MKYWRISITMKQYDVKLTTKFKKQLKKLQKQPYFNYNALNEVIKILSNGELLPEKYNNHLLNPKSNRYMGVSCITRCTT